MLTKVYTKSGRKCRVTFHVPPDMRVSTVHLCGEFNDWNTCSHPLERQPDGSFSLTLKLNAGREYRYRYFIDGYRWTTDSAADGAVTNQHNTLDSVLRLSNGTIKGSHSGAAG